MNIKARDIKQQGFTIIELMIATSVVSVVLVMVTIIMINIGNLYYKGINQSRAQDNVRAITDEVTQHLQFNNTAVKLVTGGGTYPTLSYCIGDTRYTLVIGRQIGSDPGQSTHVLWRDNVPSGSCPALPPNALDVASPLSSGPSAGTNGTELIAPRSRLINFSITPLTSPYTVIVNVGTGEDDQLCSPSAPGVTCNDQNTMNSAFFTNGDLICKGSQGQHFCATANLITTVVQRL